MVIFQIHCVFVRSFLAYCQILSHATQNFAWKDEWRKGNKIFIMKFMCIIVNFVSSTRQPTNAQSTGCRNVCYSVNRWQIGRIFAYRWRKCLKQIFDDDFIDIIIEYETCHRIFHYTIDSYMCSFLPLSWVPSNADRLPVNKIDKRYKANREKSVSRRVKRNTKIFWINKSDSESYWRSVSMV